MKKIIALLNGLLVTAFWLSSCSSQPEISQQRLLLLQDTLKTDLVYEDWQGFALELANNYAQENVAGMVAVQGMEKSILQGDAKGYGKWLKYLQEYPENGVYTTSDRIAIADRAAWMMLENNLLLEKVQATNDFSVNLFEANQEGLQWLEQIGSSIYDTRGRYLRSRGELDEALAAYNQALAFSETADILTNRGAILEEKEDLQGALEDFIAAWRLKPGEPMLVEKVRQLYARTEPESDVDAFISDLRVSFTEQRHEEVLGEMFRLPAPEFNFVDNFGHSLSNASGQGKVLLVDFWATWCQPCRRELPEYEKLYQKWSNDHRVAFIAASTDKEKNKVKPYIESSSYSFPYGHAEGQADKFGVEGIPSLFIIGPDGNIRYKIVGYNPEHDFVQEMSWRIESLLEG